MQTRDFGYGPLFLGAVLLGFPLYRDGIGYGGGIFSYYAFFLGIFSTAIGAAIRFGGIQQVQNRFKFWLLKRTATRSAEILKGTLLASLDNLERRASVRIRQRGQTVSWEIEGSPVHTRVDGKWVVAEGIVVFLDLRTRNPYAEEHDHARLPLLYMRILPTFFGSNMQIWEGDGWVTHQWAVGTAEVIRRIDCLYSTIEEVPSIGPRSSVRTAEF